MSAPEPTTLSVRLFDGVHPLAHRARLGLSSLGAELTLGEARTSYDLSELSVSPRIASAPRFVTLPDGRQLQCPDHPWLDRLPQAEQTEVLAAWLERRWSVALVAVVATLLGLGLFYAFGLARVADWVASRISPAAERRLGERTLRSLDERMLRTSTLEEREQLAIRERFGNVRGPTRGRVEPELQFRAAPFLPANAFALPGGVIVVTDQLVAAMSNRDQVVAVLMHELGHAEDRHFLRSLLANSAAAILSGLVTGDVSSVVAGSGAALLLAQSGYSRKFERQADAFALARLQAAGLSPHLLAAALERLQADRGAGDDDAPWSWLSTHPSFSERLSRARAAVVAACDAGNAPACNDLGVCHETGTCGQAVDPGRAQNLYRQACEGGDSLGCNNLALCYDKGRCGLPLDPKQAGSYYQRACDLGAMDACTALGFCYARGDCGLSLDENRAGELYRQACAGGDMQACTNLATCHLNGGCGLPKDPERAEELDRKACEGGLREACRSRK